jgi:hypothetical protein
MFLYLNDHRRSSSSIIRTRTLFSRGRIVGTSKRIVSVDRDPLHLPVLLLAYTLIFLQPRHYSTSRVLRSFTINSCLLIVFIPIIFDILNLDFKCRVVFKPFLNKIPGRLSGGLVGGGWPFYKFNGMVFGTLIERR